MTGVSRIVRQIGGAVQYLHDRNIAHRDIKLENILCSSTLVDQCTFKLADFGFAKRAERDRLMESPCCTPAYVCPEASPMGFGHSTFVPSDPRPQTVRQELRHLGPRGGHLHSVSPMINLISSPTTPFDPSVSFQSVRISALLLHARIAFLPRNARANQ